jgi:hypothetical protein
MRRVATIAAAAAVVCLLQAATQAQWLNYPTPGIPRLADGKPNMNAPAPLTPDGKPDITGIWNQCAQGGGGCPGGERLFFDLARGLPASDVQMTPWAAAVQARRERRKGVDDPFGYCLPPGVPRINFTLGAVKILQTPRETVFLHETAVGSVFHQAFTDGRPLPTVTEPTWLGYSVGRWDAGTFVVESTGFRDGGWLDTNKGHPNSDALRVTERFRRVDFGHLNVAITIDDQKAYLKPWTATVTMVYQPDAELLESFCDNHEKTMEHRRNETEPPEPPSPR